MYLFLWKKVSRKIGRFNHKVAKLAKVTTKKREAAMVGGAGAGAEAEAEAGVSNICSFCRDKLTPTRAN